MLPVLGQGVPPCGRAYFLLLRQKKAAKEKATPGYAVGFANSPALLDEPGGCGTRASPSDSPRRRPPVHLRCSALHMGTRKTSWLNRHSLNCHPHGRPEKTPKNEIHWLSVDALPGPLGGAEQRRGWRKKGEDCLRAQPEFRSPRQHRVAQGTGNAGTDRGSPSFCLLFLGEARKSKTPRKGGTPSQ